LQFLKNNVANVVKKLAVIIMSRYMFQEFRSMFSISVGESTVTVGTIRVGSRVAVGTISTVGTIGTGTIVVAVVVAIVLGFGISLGITLTTVKASIGRQAVGVGYGRGIGSRVVVGTITISGGVSGTIVVSVSQARVVLGFGISLGITLTTVEASIGRVGTIRVGSRVTVGTIGTISVGVAGTIVVSISQARVVLGFGISLGITLSTEDSVVGTICGVGTIVVESRVGPVSVSVGFGGQVGSSGNLDRGGVQGSDGAVPVPDQLGVGLGLRLGHGGENDTCENK